MSRTRTWVCSGREGRAGPRSGEKHRRFPPGPRSAEPHPSGYLENLASPLWASLLAPRCMHGCSRYRGVWRWCASCKGLCTHLSRDTDVHSAPVFSLQKTCAWGQAVLWRCIFCSALSSSLSPNCCWIPVGEAGWESNYLLPFPLLWTLMICQIS